ncbi:MAG: zinc-dependent alcohol dehydrogenase family protein [Armatimonadota bacterium]
MKAAVLTAPRRIEIQDRPVPKPGPGELLLAVHTCGVCGTDAHIYNGEFLVRFPVVPGHELSGTVVEVGSEVFHVQPGDRVTVDPNITCGVCRHCRFGRINLCENLQAVGVTRDGGFAEYCLVPAKQAYRLPEGVSLDAAAFAEPTACCIHGLERVGLQSGDTVLILGGGPIGQIMLQLCKHSGAGCVILSEPVATRRQIAVENGADAVLDPMSQDVVMTAMELTGNGADVVLECTGMPNVFEDAVRCARRGGRVLLFGMAPESAVASIRPYEVFIRELTIVGSYVNPFTHGAAVQALSLGWVKPEKLISHRFDIAELEAALSTSRNRSAMKVVVQPKSNVE